jgi:hypothetical protein
MAKVNYRRDAMIVLLKEYSRLKDELINHTEHFHDGMCYDIEGFWESVMEGDYSELGALQNQVIAFNKILEGYKLINYTFC